MIKGPRQKQYLDRQAILAKPDIEKETKDEENIFTKKVTLDKQTFLVEQISSQTEHFPTLSKKRLIQQFLALKGKEKLVMSAIYLPPILDKIVGDIAHYRGKHSTRSHLVIEALLLHPDICEELRKQGILR